MGKRKQGKRGSDSSGSESQDSGKVNKAKCVRTEDSVSENKTTPPKSDELNNSVFHETDKTENSDQNKTEIQQLTMASQNINLNTNVDVCKKLDTLITAVKDLQTGQKNMKEMFESKLDKLKSELVTTIDTKVGQLRDELLEDINRETSRTDQLLTTVQSIQTRIEKIENHPGLTGENGQDQPMNNPAIHNPLNNPDITITASGLPVSEDENLVQKANDLIRALGVQVSDNVHVTAAVRLPNYRTNDQRPGIVKISFRSTEEKVNVLRNKMKLRESEQYKNVYIKSSKSRVERIIESNARAVLRNLPEGRSLRVDATGRIKVRNNQNQGDTGNGNDGNERPARR